MYVCVCVCGYVFCVCVVCVCVCGTFFSFLRFLGLTHSNSPQSMGLLWTSDQRVAETSTQQNRTLTTDRPCYELIPRLLISPYPDQERNNLRSVSGTCAISTTSRRELSSSFFPASKAPKLFHAILTETLSCFLPTRSKD